MRLLFDIGLLVAVILGVLVIAGQCSAEPYDKRTKIYDERNRRVGSIYCPTGQRRCQILDNNRKIRYYLERDGDITLPNRKKVKEIELPGTD